MRKLASGNQAAREVHTRKMGSVGMAMANDEWDKIKDILSEPEEDDDESETDGAARDA